MSTYDIIIDLHYLYNVQYMTNGYNKDGGSTEYYGLGCKVIKKVL